MSRVIENFTKYRYLLIELIKKDIKLKYRNSVLGIVWTLLEPLLTMIVLTVVFTEIFEKSIVNFPIYVLTGRLLYGFFSGGTRSALKAVRNNSSMIRKVYVPKYIYPLASTISSFIIFLISLIVLVGVGLVQKVTPTVYLFGALVPVAALLLMTIGIGFILATMEVFFRDTEYLWGVLLMIIMYVSAIFYPAEKLLNSSTIWKQWLVRYNPLYAVIANFRNAVFGVPLDSFYTWYSLIFGVASLIIGTLVFYRKQDKFILHI
jgi:ABC-2 type transport system permease protein